MKFSTRTTYGLRAVLCLACGYGAGSLAASAIAKKEGIPGAYLEQILNALKKKGFVRTMRGPHGGYVLNKKPSEIGLDELFYTLAPKAFEEIRQQAVSENPGEAEWAERLFWTQLKAALDGYLKKSTLYDLVTESRKLKKSDPAGRFTFHI